MNNYQFEKLSEHISSDDLGWIESELKDTSDQLDKLNKKYERLMNLRTIASADLVETK